MLDEDNLKARSRIVKRLRDTWTHGDANMAKTEEEEQEGRGRIEFPDTALSEKQQLEDKLRALAVLEDEFSDGGKGKKKKGKLTNRLLEQGLVTPAMLRQLKREIAKEDS